MWNIKIVKKAKKASDISDYMNTLYSRNNVVISQFFITFFNGCNFVLIIYVMGWFI